MNISADAAPLYRSLLFIPAGSPRMLAKMESLQPDAFILDLEDSLPLDQKEKGRENVRQKMNELERIENKTPIYVRTNDLDTSFWADDIKLTISPRLNGYLIPKFESNRKAEGLVRLLTRAEQSQGIPRNSVKLLLQIESMKGILELGRLSARLLSKRLTAIVFGGEDFLLDLYSSHEISREMLNYARHMIILHAKGQNLRAIDTVYTDFKDISGLEKESSWVAGMGFDGKLAIHPSQIAIINASFSLSAEEVKRMKSILEHRSNIEKEGAINLEGVMLDRAHLKWALRAYGSWVTRQTEEGGTR